jgi:hypothetical protein
MRHHFTADFREARQPPFNVEKSIFIEAADIASLEPTISKNFRGLFRRIEVAFKNIRAPQPEHAGIVERFFFVGIRIADLGCHTGQKFPGRAEPVGWLDRFA